MHDSFQRTITASNDISDSCRWGTDWPVRSILNEFSEYCRTWQPIPPPLLSASRKEILQLSTEHACKILGTCEYWERCLCQTLRTLTWLLHYQHVTSYWPVMSHGIWHDCISVQQHQFNIQDMFTCVVTPCYLLATPQRTFSNLHLHSLLLTPSSLRFWRQQVNQSLYKSGQALRSPGGSGCHTSRQSAHEDSKVVSLMHRPPLPPLNIPGTHFCYKLSQPQDHYVARRIT